MMDDIEATTAAEITHNEIQQATASSPLGVVQKSSHTLNCRV